VFPSRLPRDLPPPGPDGRPSTRWTDPRLAAAYAERDDSFDQAVVWPALTEVVRPQQPRRASGRPDGSVLDLGCGLGGFAHRLANEEWTRTYAVDTSPAMHRIGSARFRDAWIIRTAPDSRGRLPIRVGHCTAAVAHLLMTHLAHPCFITGALSEARRVMRTGAPLALVEPGSYGRCDGPVQWGEPGQDPAEAEPFFAYYRLRTGARLAATAWRHSPATIAGCLAAADFAVEEIRPLGPGIVGISPLLLWRARAV
jgi:SAM-dependent methyltransferase